VEHIIELVMIRDNMLQLSSNVFSLMDIRDVISFFMYKWIVYLYVFCVVFIFLLLFMCTSCTILYDKIIIRKVQSVKYVHYELQIFVGLLDSFVMLLLDKFEISKLVTH